MMEGVGMRTVSKWLAMAAALAAGMSVQAALITNSFTTAEGFVSGGLDGQKGWNAQAGWTVDPSGGGKVGTTSTGQRAIYGESFKMASGESLTFRTEFKLLGTLATPTANTSIMSFGVRTDADETSNSAAFHNTQLSLYQNGNIVLRGRNNNPPTITLGTIAANGSANLAVEYTINVGATAAESTFDMKFINLDTAAFATGSFSGLDETIYIALTSGNGVYSLLNSTTFTQNGTGVTGIDVYSTTVIPEPATIGMLGLGALLTLGLRRKLTR